MSATLIDGKAFAARVKRRLAERVETLKSRHGIMPGLAVVLVGEDPASQVYVRNKADCGSGHGILQAGLGPGCQRGSVA